MVIRPLSKELQIIAINELNENKHKINEDLERLREWLKKQIHLNVRSDDQSLITFLRGCKWSVQRAKDKIDYFYTIRTLIPEYFTERDPFDPELKRVIKRGLAYPLPNSENPGGARIIFLDFSAIDYETMTIKHLIKILFMTIDLLMAEDDNFVVSGQKMIVNYAGVPASFWLQATPSVAKKFCVCWQNAYPIRMKQLIGINTPEAMETLYNTIGKPLLTNKFRERIHLFSLQNNHKAYKLIPKEFFPKEHGGENGSCSVLAEQYKRKLESCRDWFLEDYQYKSNEALRSSNLKGYNDELNMDGTFRKLEID